MSPFMSHSDALSPDFMEILFKLGGDQDEKVVVDQFIITFKWMPIFF